MKKLLVLVLSLALLLTLAACTPDFWRESTSAKAVIYLYPEETRPATPSRSRICTRRRKRR